MVIGSAVLPTKYNCYTAESGTIKQKRDYMTDLNSNSLPLSDSWDTYWHDTLYGAAYTSGGISHPAIQTFWDDFFRAARAQYDAPKIIDIASGNGAVVECAKSAFGGQLPLLDIG